MACEDLTDHATTTLYRGILSCVSASQYYQPNSLLFLPIELPTLLPMATKVAPSETPLPLSIRLPTSFPSHFESR